MAASPLLNRLMTALRCLPGVGPKSAQRMALHLLERDRDGARRLVESLQAAVDGIGRCRLCRDLSETEICALCANSRRDHSLLCVIETPADVLAVEQATGFQGVYFVLMGHLSPLDGIGPAELGLETLEARLAGGEVREVILADAEPDSGRAAADRDYAARTLGTLAAPPWLPAADASGVRGVLQRQTYNVPADRREGTYVWGDTYLLAALALLDVS